MPRTAKPRKARPGAAKPVKLLSGGNPQIAKADGDAPVQAYLAAMPGWKRDEPRAKGTSRASKPRTARALGDSKNASKIRFSATLLRPVATAKAVAWTFLTLPKEAS